MCNVEGCVREKAARGFCHRHYGQWRRGRRAADDFRADMELAPESPRNRVREVPPWEPGLVTHTPAGLILLHGEESLSTYATYGCRCRACTEASRARQEANRRERERKTRGGEIPSTVKHGTDSTYRNWGCRCDACQEAGSKQYATYYRKNLSAEARRKQRESSYDLGFEDGSTGKPNRNPARG